MKFESGLVLYQRKNCFFIELKIVVVIQKYFYSIFQHVADLFDSHFLLLSLQSGSLRRRSHMQSLVGVVLHGSLLVFSKFV